MKIHQKTEKKTKNKKIKQIILLLNTNTKHRPHSRAWPTTARLPQAVMLYDLEGEKDP